MSESKDPGEWKIWKAALRNVVFLIILFVALFVLGKLLG
jgi:hypothetical protein